MQNTRLLWLGFLVPLGLWAQTPQSAPSLPTVEAGELTYTEVPQTPNRGVISLSFQNLSSGNTTYGGLTLGFSAVVNDPEMVHVSLIYGTSSPLKTCLLASLTADGKRPTILADGYSNLEIPASAIVDSKRPSVSAGVYSSGLDLSAINGSYSYSSYSYVLTVLWKDFASFRSAKKIEGTLCGMSFALTQKERSALKAFGDLLASLRVSPALPEVPVGLFLREHEPKTGIRLLTLSLEKLSHQKKKYDQLSLLMQAYEAGATEVELSISYGLPESQDKCEKKLSLTADGKALTLLKDVTYSSNDRRSYRLQMSLSRDEFASLVKAKKIEGEFCGASFLLTKKQQKSLIIYEKSLTR